jgi:cytochrome P450
MTNYKGQMTKDKGHFPPGPKSIVPGRIIYRMLRHSTDFVTEVAREYGDVASFSIGRRRIWLLSHPEHIRDVLVNRAENFTKGPALRMAKVTLGEGLLTSEGDYHRRQRRMMQPAFHTQRVAAYAPAMVRFAQRARDSWTSGQVVEIRSEMTRLTLEIISKILFDAEIESEVREVSEAMDVTVRMFDRSRNPLAFLLNRIPILPSNLRFLRAKGRVFDTLDRMIAQRRATSGRDPQESANGSANHRDFLSILLRARDVEGDRGGMTDEQLRFEAMTLFAAGHETTANAMVWTWYLLARHPEAEARLHAEVDAMLGGRAPTAEDLERLPYVRAVISESMRLYPPAWVIGRQAKQEHAIGQTGWTVPEGGVVLMSQYVVHRDSRWWERAEEFSPERWLSNEEASRRPRYAYFPFGGGPRQCVGEAMAWLEAELLLATIAQRWKLRLAEPRRAVRLHATITLRPRDTLRMRVEPRE